jgi:hypothetical protein
MPCEQRLGGGGRKLPMNEPERLDIFEERVMPARSEDGVPEIRHHPITASVAGQFPGTILSLGLFQEQRLGRGCGFSISNWGLVLWILDHFRGIRPEPDCTDHVFAHPQSHHRIVFVREQRGILTDITHRLGQRGVAAGKRFMTRNAVTWHPRDSWKSVGAAHRLFVSPLNRYSHTILGQ